jgi:Collagen triple helix repeat (20 copies)
MFRQTSRVIFIRSSLSGMSLLAFAAACSSSDSTVTSSDDSAPEETIAVAQFALKSSLPACNNSSVGNVYYVVKDEQLVYCDGKNYQDVEFPCDPTWLVSAGAAASCPYGGSTLRAGPDNNGNGKLDKKEVVSSATACNGARGATGPTGSQGPAGANGANGATGTAGANGATGAQGPQGPAGSSCNVEDDVAVPGGAIIRCENGFVVRIFDGQDGATGAPGATGATGPVGANGTNGTNGSSCSVDDNGDGSYLLTCTDGTNVTLHDGNDGAVGATGPQGPAGVSGQNGATGPAGPAGANGQNGATGPQGAQGPAGSSCTVNASGDHSYDVTCPDGSHATVHDGQDATLGPVLLNIVPEPKGATCHAGGHRVDVGVDIDNSGVLEADEVTGSEYACASLITIYGSVALSSDADLELVRGVREIQGSLLVTGSVTLAAFEQATSDLSSISALQINHTAFTSLSFDQPSRIDRISIQDNASLTSFSFDQLQTVGVLYVYNNAALTSFSFDQLQTVDFLDVSNNAALTSFSFDQLQTPNGLRINENAALTSLSGLDTLGHVQYLFEVRQNVSLPTCEAQRIRALLDNSPTTYIDGNDDAGVCL